MNCDSQTTVAKRERQEVTDLIVELRRLNAITVSIPSLII